MTFLKIMGRLLGGRRPTASAPRRQPGSRLRLEPLEDRTVPANFTAANVADLIADIHAANDQAGADTIVLAPGVSFTLTEVDNYTLASTGLPVISGNDGLTILGTGNVIERSSAPATADFRLFAVAAGASLTLEHLTLQGGRSVPALNLDSSFHAQGGAVCNQGSLTLRDVIVQDNVAAGALGGGTSGLARGGGIYSTGSLTLEDCTLRNNVAAGGNGFPASTFLGAATPGGDGLGGGLYIAGSIATITNSTITANAAQGGHGGNGLLRNGIFVYSGAAGGSGFGGGVYAAGGSVSFHNVTITDNSAQAGEGGEGGKSPHGSKAGSGVGGGLYIDPAALAALDDFTINHAKTNHASTNHSNIHGSYDRIP